MTPPDGSPTIPIARDEDVLAAGPAMPVIRWFARRTTGIKLLLVMALLLAPLGLIALLASIDSARANSANRAAGANAVASGSARSLEALIVRTELTLRGASTALAGIPAPPTACRQTLSALAAANRVPVEFAMVDDRGALVCSTGRFGAAGPAGAAAGATISADGRTLQVATAAVAGRAFGVARFDAAAIANVIQPAVDDGRYRLVLRQGDRMMTFGRSAEAMADGLRLLRPVGHGEIEFALTLPAQRVTASEAISVLLPLLMLLAAGGVAWLVVDRLMLRPLGQLQAAVLAYRGTGTGAIPRFATPATEIRDLADAFRRVTAVIVQHEGELEEGLTRQTRLTREVHHRVKNNLQVVASLLNLHARGAATADVRDAYASIQRRVDALAVVHRNHFAELEENRGVALRPLIGELAANLRASAPRAAQSMRLLLDLEPLYATQDVAVPIAFLITELIETSMLREPNRTASISLHALPHDTRALLTIRSQALTGGALAEAEVTAERIERVIVGLSRQLRSSLQRDEQAGSIAIEIAVVGRD